MIAAIENAILARLKAAGDAGVLGYRYRTLETYPENWDEALADKVVDAPAAWVVFAGFGAPDPDALTPRMPATFGLVVMARNARNETATRHGGPNPAAEPGAYQLVEDALALLAFDDLGLDIAVLTPGPVRPVRPPRALAQQKVAMYALELRTTFAVAAIESDGDVADFATFHVDWDIPAFASPAAIDAAPATPGVQLPDDPHADAVDHLHLEQAP